MRRRGQGVRRLSDHELLEAWDEWRRLHPMPAGGDLEDSAQLAWQAWHDQEEAWLAEHGTDSNEVWRLRSVRYVGRLRWQAEQEGWVWGGVDVPPWPPEPSPNRGADC